jgi:hypothetical protein
MVPLFPCLRTLDISRHNAVTDSGILALASCTNLRKVCEDEGG